MAQIPILNGVYVGPDSDFRTSYPRNRVPVPKDTGIAAGYLKPAPGVAQNATGQGNGRGGINWNGALYRVSGTKLIKIDATNKVTVIGSVADGGQCSFDYSFDRLAIAAGGNLYYFDGNALSQVTDQDLGVCIDVQYIAGYFMTTDGTDLIVTELNDPTSVNPLKYGSSEADPDPIVSVRKLRNEAYAFNRYTIEVFDNIGGTLFPFQVNEGALIPRGAVGTHAICSLLQTFAFVGSGRNEAPGVYLMGAGVTQKISTREIDVVLRGYTDQQLSTIVVEAKVDDNHQTMLIHLPDQCLAYDAAATAIVGQPVWYSLTSSLIGLGTYRARSLVWCYGQWNVDDPTSSALGQLTNSTSDHYGMTIGWEFQTVVIYRDGGNFILHSMELIGTPGRVALGVDPTIWSSYSLDGETWSVERPKSAGKQGERGKNIAWRKNGGHSHDYRIQKFRGTSDAHMSIAALEVEMEPIAG